MAPESSNLKPEKKTSGNNKHSKRKAKTKASSKKNSLLASVIKKIKNNELTIEEAFEKYEISYKTVSERLRCVSCNGNHNSEPCPILVFTTEQQKKLRDHIIKCSKTQYGLTNTTIRKMAYEYAKKLPCCDYPKKWDEQNMAGVNWYLNFRSRHPQLKKSLSKTLQHTCICIKGCHMGPEGKEAFEQLEAKLVIARVYHYLQKEYEYMKMCNDLGLLVNILRRTAEATGVCEQTIASILEDEKREAEELHQSLTVHKVKKKKKKKSSAAMDHDYAVNGEENRNNSNRQNEQVKPVAEKMIADVIDTGPTKINEQVKPVPENMIVDLTDTGPTKMIEQDLSVAENVIVDAMDTGPTNANGPTFTPDSGMKAPDTTGNKARSILNINGLTFTPDSGMKAPDTTGVKARSILNINEPTFSPDSGMKAPDTTGNKARSILKVNGPTFTPDSRMKAPDTTGIKARSILKVNGPTLSPDSRMKAPDTTGIKARSILNINGPTFSPYSGMKVPDTTGNKARSILKVNGPTFTPDSRMKAPDTTGIKARSILNINGPTFSPDSGMKAPDTTGIKARSILKVNGPTFSPDSGMKAPDTTGIKSRSILNVNRPKFSPNLMVKIPDLIEINSRMKVNANRSDKFSPDSGMRVPDAAGIDAGKMMGVNRTSNGIADDGPSPSYSLNPSFSINIEYTDFERLQQNASMIKSVEVEILEDDFDEPDNGEDKSRQNCKQDSEDRTLVIDAYEPEDEDSILVIDDNESQTTEAADIDDITLVIDDNEYETTTGPADIDDITLVIDDNECQTTAGPEDYDDRALVIDDKEYQTSEQEEDLDDEALVIDTSKCQTTEQNDQDDVDYKLKEYPIDIKHSKLNEPIADKNEQNSTDIVSNRAPTKLNELIGNVIEKNYMEVEEDSGPTKINEPAESRSEKISKDASDRISTQLNELIESENEKLDTLYISKLNGAPKKNIATSATKNNNSNKNKRRGGIEGYLKRREKCMTEDKKEVKRTKSKEYCRKKEAERTEQEKTEKMLRILRKTTGQVQVGLSFRDLFELVKGDLKNRQRSINKILALQPENLSPKDNSSLIRKITLFVDGARAKKKKSGCESRFMSRYQEWLDTEIDWFPKESRTEVNNSPATPISGEG